MKESKILNSQLAIDLRSGLDIVRIPDDMKIEDLRGKLLEDEIYPDHKAQITRVFNLVKDFAGTVGDLRELNTEQLGRMRSGRHGHGAGLATLEFLKTLLK